MDVCESCDAPIRWVALSGRAHPVDPNPDESGNVVVTERTTNVTERGTVPIAALSAPPIPGQGAMFGSDAGQRHRSHFASCPDADAWRHVPAH